MIIMNKVINVLVFLLSCNSLLAADPIEPPPPSGPPPPPGMSIDGDLLILFVLALVSGYYLSKKYIFIRKGSL